MSDQTIPTIYRHARVPEWGRGILIDEAEGKHYFHFEHGGRRVFKKSSRPQLEPVEMPADEATALDEILRERAQPETVKSHRAGTKKRGTLTAPKMPFSEQVSKFQELFPEGFGGEAFERLEAQLFGNKNQTLSKSEVIGMAQEQFSEEAFANHDCETIFESAKNLLAASSLVYPIEGTIVLGAMEPEQYPGFCEALKNLLHGEGDFAARFDAYVASLEVKDQNGAAKRRTWPLCTYFPAIFNPSERIFVKPTIMREQAKIVGLRSASATAPNGKTCMTFQKIALEVTERLKQFELEPRDMLDVHLFMWTTLSASSKKVMAASAKPAKKAPQPKEEPATPE